MNSDPGDRTEHDSVALEENRWWFGRATVFAFVHPTIAIPYLEVGPYSSDFVAQLRLPFVSVFGYSVGFGVFTVALRAGQGGEWTDVQMLLTLVSLAWGISAVYRTTTLARRVTRNRASALNDVLERELATLWLMAALLVFTAMFVKFGSNTLLAQLVVLGLAAIVIVRSAPTGRNIRRLQQQIQDAGSGLQLSLHRDRRVRRNR